MTEREIATKILQAMELREKSYDYNIDYSKSILDCFNEVFEGSALGKLYALATISCWNETESWCADILNCEALKY